MLALRRIVAPSAATRQILACSNRGGRRTFFGAASAKSIRRHLPALALTPSDKKASHGHLSAAPVPSRRFLGTAADKKAAGRDDGKGRDAPLFDRVLIANRGEIAERVIRTCDRLGIETVAVYSTADAQARFVRQATHSYCIGPPAASLSYLNVPAVLDAITRSGAQAVHPGYVRCLREDPS
jgi:hypothetical protein